MNEKTIDGELLVKVIQMCFSQSQIEGITKKQSRELITLGKKLRGVLLNMLTAKFDGDTQLFKDATAELKAANKELKDALEDLQKTADAIKKVTSAFKLLDKLLGIAAGFL